MDLTGQTLLGKYEIEGLLGQGGMGAVWRARHSMTGRKLAIKVLDESYVDNEQVSARFGREARAASMIQHPGIVEVLDLDSTDAGVPFIVMEFLEGETLARRIERRGKLDEAEMVRLGTMLLEALDAAHSHGVIHRDLKPENIYVVPAGRRGEAVKILDFGISHMQSPQESKLTMTGSVLGTPHYMSPEQAMGETRLDHRADLYAAGVVLYECVVGDVPYDAPNYNKLLRLILDKDPPLPRSRDAAVSPQVERVILWAMEKDRENRIPSAREMLNWLGRAAAGEEPPYSGRLSEPDVEVEMSEREPARQPAGALPSHTSGTFSLDSAWSPSTPPSRQSTEPPDVPDEEPSPGWTVSPTLAKMASSPPSSTPPPSGSVELDMGLELSGSHEPMSLELDEQALRASNRPSSMGQRAAVGTASSSGRYSAVKRSSPGAHVAVRDSSPGSLPAPPPASGLHSVPPRISELELEEASHAEPEPPAWRRYALFAVIALAVFTGLVFAVRYVTDTDDDPTNVTDPTPTTDPDRPTRPNENPWINVRIVGLPPGARLSLDGLPASSPLRLRRGADHTLTIRADGYEERTIALETDRDRTIHARMVPAVGTVQGAP